MCQTEDVPSCTWQSERYSEMCTVFWTVCLLTTKHPPDLMVASIYFYVIQVSILVCTIYMSWCVHGGSVGWDTAVQIGRPRVRFPMVSGFFFTMALDPTQTVVLKSGSPNTLEPPRPVQGLLYLIYIYIYIYIYMCVCVCVCVCCCCCWM